MRTNLLMVLALVSTYSLLFRIDKVSSHYVARHQHQYPASTDRTAVNKISSYDSNNNAQPSPQFEQAGSSIEGNPKQKSIVQPLKASSRHKREINDASGPKCEPESLTHRPAIFGLRCDEGGDVASDGALIIKANEPTKMYLIGRNLNRSHILIALTPSDAPAQDDCTHTDRVKSLQISNSISSNVAEIVVNIPSPGAGIPFYLCLRDNTGSNTSTGSWYHQGSDPWLKIYVKQDILPLYMKIIVIACLLMLSGLFSGLNLGLMALDKNELQVIISCGSEREKRFARAIEPVRRRGNYLLCSILFSNVLVNSTIAVLLEELTSGIVAVMTSTIFIVMFGEILPQAFCSRHGLAVGAKTVGITYFCMIVTFPLSYPVSRCLDLALGEEIGHAYDRERLMEFIRVTRDYNNLEADEVAIISGALKLKRIQVSEVMTKMDDVYMLDEKACLDFDTVQAIIERGYSRIPVHEANNKRNIVALLFAKDLALLDPDDKTPVQTMINFYNHPVMYLFEDDTLDLALHEFKTGKSHMAFVRRVLDDGDRDPVYEITGIVTLEDVIENIIQMQINDETDILSDNRRQRPRNAAQGRRDFSQFTNLGGGDSSHYVITPQLCLAAYQYLATTVEPFSPHYISDSILKRLLSHKIYYKVRVDDNKLSRNDKRVYKAGEPADYFIMILEGRVQVICGKENLSFEGGPFSFFGKAALSPSITTTAAAAADKLADLGSISNSSNLSQQRKESITYKQPPAALPQERRESLVTAKTSTVLNGQFSISMKKLEQLVAEADSAAASPLLSSSCTVPAAALGTATRLGPSDSRASIYSLEKLQSAKFVPDYTVEIIANTSYLKVTRNEYLAALRATLVERDGVALEDEGGSDSEQNIISTS